MSLLALVWLSNASYQIIDFLRVDDTVHLPALEDGHQVVQSFIAPEDGLSRVDIMIVQGGSSGGQVKFELLSVSDLSLVPDDATTIREVHEDVSSLESTDPHRFEFEPVPDSAGRAYAVRLSGNGETRSGSDSLLGDLFLDGRPIAGDLRFAVFHTTGIGGLLARIAPFRPLWLGSSSFFIGLFTVGAACCGFLLWMIAFEKQFPNLRG